MESQQTCLECKNAFWGELSEIFCPSCESSRASENRRAYRENISKYSYTPNYPASTGKSVSQTVKSSDPVPERIPERARKKTIQEIIQEQRERTIQEQFEKDFPDKNIKNIYVVMGDGKYTNNTNPYLDLREYKELRSIDFSSIYCEPPTPLVSINLSECKELVDLILGNNSLNSVAFLNDLPSPEKLKRLELQNNNIQPTNISIFSRFINLE